MYSFGVRLAQRNISKIIRNTPCLLTKHGKPLGVFIEYREYIKMLSDIEVMRYKPVLEALQKGGFIGKRDDLLKLGGISELLLALQGVNMAIDDDELYINQSVVNESIGGSVSVPSGGVESVGVAGGLAGVTNSLSKISLIELLQDKKIKHSNLIHAVEKVTIPPGVTKHKKHRVKYYGMCKHGEKLGLCRFGCV